MATWGQLGETRKYPGEAGRLDCEQGDGARLGMGQKGGGRQKDAPRRQKEKEGGGLLEECTPSSSEAGTVGCMQAGLGVGRGHDCCSSPSLLPLRVQRMEATAAWRARVASELSPGDSEDTDRCRDADG